MAYCWTLGISIILWLLWLLWVLLRKINGFIRFLAFKWIGINWWINRIIIFITLFWSHHIIKRRKLLWFFYLIWGYICRLKVLRTMINIRSSFVWIYIIANWNLVSTKTTLISTKSLISTKTTLITTKSLISTKTALISSESLISTKTTLISRLRISTLHIFFEFLC